MASSDPPPLSTPAEASLQALRAKDPPPVRGDIDRLENVFRQMGLAVAAVIGDSGEVHDGKKAVLGLMARTHDLLLGVTDAVESDNRHVATACLRGLVETFGALVLGSEAADRLPLLVWDDWQPSGKKLADAAARRLPRLESDYKWLNEAVHPGWISLGFSFRPTGEADEEKGVQPLRFNLSPPPPFEEHEVEQTVRMAASLGEWVLKEVKDLVEKDPAAFK